MKRFALLVAAVSGAAMLPLMAGCEHEVSHQSETVSHPDGSSSHVDKTVTQKPNGDIVTDTNKQNP